ncbi:MAG: D-alanyl-D-alanine carboxypeptidase/D-alanyl-D-alanine-endopeptidase [Pleurocapsa sp.]
MKSICSYLKYVAIATAFTLTHTTLIPSVNANTAIRLDRNLDSIDIYVPPPERNTPGICSDSIESIINNVVERKDVNQGKWGILVQSLDGTTIYNRSPDSYMIPASNAKLLVTAAALQQLDPGGQINSKSLREWITVTNLRSNNNYANILLSYLGGSQSVQRALTPLGIDPKGYRLSDGSGLSRNNLITPRTLVSTLRAMYHSPGHDIFFASLPVAGVSGTLQNRLRNSIAQGTVRAKTGTLKGVRSLSGYIENPEYGTLAFSIITNQPISQPIAPVVSAIDEIVTHLSTLTPCQ